MDYLKTEAPFWKKETSGKASKWVEARKSDLFAQKKWDK
jgi:molybdopterin synthase catalytic subunit